MTVRMFPFTLLFIIFMTILRPSSYGAVTWEEQSERLLRVNATLLDGFPVPTPFFYQSFSLGVFADMTVLPKVNPKVGSKSEKVPSSPIHAIPSVKARYFAPISNTFGVGLGVSAGYLPAGSEKLFQIKASLNQWSLGVETAFRYSLSNNVELWLPLFFHRTVAKVRGAITTNHAHDTFSTHTNAIGYGVGASMETFWFQVMVGPKISNSTFFIESDKTTLQTMDALSDETPRGFVQGTLGWQHKSGVYISFSELWVPSRVLVPRLSVGFDWSSTMR